MNKIQRYKACVDILLRLVIRNLFLLSIHRRFMGEVVLETPSLTVIQKQLGSYENLNHLIVCRETLRAAIIDPFDGQYWIEYCNVKGYQLEAIWLTHSHWDHTKGVDDILAVYPQLPIVLHVDEEKRGWNGSTAAALTQNKWNYATINVGKVFVDAYLTPGHTPGHLTFVHPQFIASGDCMFLGRCGRVDLFGGDETDQRTSLKVLKQLLQSMDFDALVLPGHRYVLSSGKNPSLLTVGEFLNVNQAILAVDDDDAWRQLEFLRFDDALARKALKQKLNQS